jgi:methionine synthase I (cobalamin-dependent)
MSIEDIAADLARQRRAAAAARSAAQRRKAQRGNWIAGTVGVLLSIGLLVGGRVLGLI